MQTISTPPYALLMLLALGLIALAVGVLLVRRGLRGRRHGNTPHCRLRLPAAGH